MPRPISALIYPERLKHNILTLKRRCPNAELMAVVKANAYGHGIERIFSGLDAADGVALLDLKDAVWMRQRGWTKPITLLEGAFESADLNVIGTHRLDVVIHRESQLVWLNDAINQGLGFSYLRVYLKINTGMNRLGFTPHKTLEVASELARLQKAGAIADIVLTTHYANADSVDVKGAGPHAGEQWAFLNQLHQQLCSENTFIKPPRLSAGNSAAMLKFPDLVGDVARPGIAVYGAQAGPTSCDAEGLLPVMELRSEIIAVQDVLPGQRVGYGSRWVAEKPSRIAVVACGYADGYPRHAPDGTPVLVHGQRCGLAGRVSMDMITVDISDIPTAGVGSSVVLWGDGLPVDEVASAARTIGYELLCSVTLRVPFKVVL